MGCAVWLCGFYINAFVCCAAVFTQMYESSRPNSTEAVKMKAGKKYMLPMTFTGGRHKVITCGDESH